jgi:hypothetical protein
MDLDPQVNSNFIVNVKEIFESTNIFAATRMLAYSILNRTYVSFDEAMENLSIEDLILLLKSRDDYQLLLYSFLLVLGEGTMEISHKNAKDILDRCVTLLLREYHNRITISDEIFDRSKVTMTRDFDESWIVRSTKN